MNSYTIYMEEQAFIKNEELNEENMDYEELINYLNSPNRFRSFGDGLRNILEDNLVSLNTDPILAIKDACAKQNIPVSEIGSDNTLKNWFRKEMRPDKGTDSRRKMFALAFAFNMSVEMTNKLFHNVYLDRSFDFKKPVEIIYYYCIRNGRTWRDAECLINEYNSSIHFAQSEMEQGTNTIQKTIKDIQTDEELLYYLKRSYLSFSKLNVRAHNTVKDLLDNAGKFARDEASLERSCSTDVDFSFRGSNQRSNSFIFEVITRISPSGSKGTKTLFQNSRLPKEIKKRFPEAGSFSKKNPTYEELRKMIILLKSYSYWYQLQKSGYLGDLDNYIDEVNDVLCDSGLSEMYFGNPYDWLFLYCSMQEMPLEVFREIISEVLELRQ